MIRFLLHYKIDQVVIGVDSGALLALAKHTGAPHIPSSHIRQRTMALVFKFDALGASGMRRVRGMTALTCLNAGLFIRGQHVFIVS